MYNGKVQACKNTGGASVSSQKPKTRSVLGLEGGIVLGIKDNLGNGAHSSSQCDEQADETDELQYTPLQAKPLHLCIIAQQIHCRSLPKTMSRSRLGVGECNATSSSNSSKSNSTRVAR